MRGLGSLAAQAAKVALQSGGVRTFFSRPPSSSGVGVLVGGNTTDFTEVLMCLNSGQKVAGIERDQDNGHAATVLNLMKVHLAVCLDREHKIKNSEIVEGVKDALAKRGASEGEVTHWGIAAEQVLEGGELDLSKVFENYDPYLLFSSGIRPVALPPSKKPKVQSSEALDEQSRYRGSSTGC